MWCDVIEALAYRYHVVAPDLPTFANLTKTIDQFTEHSIATPQYLGKRYPTGAVQIDNTQGLKL